jgi:hypothetical protein
MRMLNSDCGKKISDHNRELCKYNRFVKEILMFLEREERRKEISKPEQRRGITTRLHRFSPEK